jgi:sulfur-oxidizing protein SoxA
MNKVLTIISVAALMVGVAVAASAGDKSDPKKDLEEFQGYFKSKYPDVAFDEWSNGLYAFPAAADRRAEWEQIEEFPPYELELDKGKQFWEKNNLASCFKNGGKGIAQNYPYWDKANKELRTVEEDINACLTRLGKEPIKDLNKGTMAEVAAYFKFMSRGNRVSPDVDWSDPDLVKEYEYGKHYFWSKRGQLNFSCADCHVHSAGKFIGGNILSASLGHGTGFPVYRNSWGGLGTLHRRYGGCNEQVRAAKLKPQSREYKALELYETYMGTGLPLTAPSNRG